MKYEKTKYTPEKLLRWCHIHKHKKDELKRTQILYKMSFYVGAATVLLGVALLKIKIAYAVSFLLASMISSVTSWYNLSKFKRLTKEVRVSSKNLFENYRVIDIGDDYVGFLFSSRQRRINVEIGNLTENIVADLMQIKYEEHGQFDKGN